MSVFDPINHVVGYITGRMSYLDERHQLIIQNIAQADTPNYKAKDLEFTGFMQDEMAQSSAASSFNPVFVEPDTKIVDIPDRVKADGNTVDIEKQMASMTDNSMEYMAATEILRRNLALIKYSISNQ